MAVGRTVGEITPRTPDELDSAGFVNQYGLSRKHLFEAVKASLERLQVDYIDLYWCKANFIIVHERSTKQHSCSIGHRFDYNTPIEETVCQLSTQERLMSQAAFRCKHYTTSSRRDTYAISG